MVGILVCMYASISVTLISYVHNTSLGENRARRAVETPDEAE